MKTLEMKNKTNHDFSLIIAGQGNGSVRPLSTTRGDEYVNIPGRHGGILRPGALQMSHFTVNFLYRNTKKDWFKVRADIAKWLDSDDEVEIRVDDEPGVYFIGKATNYEIPAIVGLDVSFSVEFTVQPFRYKPLQTLTVDPSNSNSFTINNTGNHDADYMLEITVQTAASSLSVSVNNRELTYNDSVRNGDVITIDSAGLELRLNDDLKVLEVGGVFSKLNSGPNTISVSTGSLVEAKWQELVI